MPGLVYGLRAHGPYAPEQGHRFNPHKLLLDPWAPEIVGRHRWRPEHHGYELGHPDGARSFDSRDNAAIALKARVPAPPVPAPGWFNAPRHATADLVLLELHVKGFTMLHPGIPEALRGTYAGLAHPAAIAHFKALGVTTLSLLPVQYALDEPALVERGLVNYWGYNTLGFFCPDPRHASAGDDPTAVADEFRQMVATLHDARPGGGAGRGLQPHARRRRNRRHAELPRPGPRQLVPPGARRQEPLRKPHRLRQHASTPRTRA